MPDTTIKKVEAGTSPRGEMGQKYLVAGKRVSMRLWVQEPGGKLKGPTKREYETVGYVISGSARLDLEGQTLNLKAGDSWLVPAGAMHQYTIIEAFTCSGGNRASGGGPRSRCTGMKRDSCPAYAAMGGGARLSSCSDCCTIPSGQTDKDPRLRPAQGDRVCR
jgi:quercetin dioxygenase-like cupin family protein